MNTSEKINWLYQNVGSSVRIVNPGFWSFLCNSRGYLWITDQGNQWHVFRSSGEETHYQLKLSGFGCDFDKSSGQKGSSYETAISLWQVTNKAEANRIYIMIKGLIDEVYAYYFNRSK